MKEFRYQRAGDVPGAVALLAADPQACFLGGGTNLVDLMKCGVERPSRLIDIRRLPLDRIEPTREGGYASVRLCKLGGGPLQYRPASTSCPNGWRPSSMCVPEPTARRSGMSTAASAPYGRTARVSTRSPRGAPFLP